MPNYCVVVAAVAVVRCKGYLGTKSNYLQIAISSNMHIYTFHALFPNMVPYHALYMYLCDFSVLGVSISFPRSPLVPYWLPLDDVAPLRRERKMKENEDKKKMPSGMKEEACMDVF